MECNMKDILACLSVKVKLINKTKEYGSQSGGWRECETVNTLSTENGVNFLVLTSNIMVLLTYHGTKIISGKKNNCDIYM